MDGRSSVGRGRMSDRVSVVGWGRMDELTTRSLR